MNRTDRHTERLQFIAAGLPDRHADTIHHACAHMEDLHKLCVDLIAYIAADTDHNNRQQDAANRLLNRWDQL